jgi:hypothetical protein
MRYRIQILYKYKNIIFIALILFILISIQQRVTNSDTILQMETTRLLFLEYNQTNNMKLIIDWTGFFGTSMTQAWQVNNMFLCVLIVIT